MTTCPSGCCEYVGTGRDMYWVLSSRALEEVGIVRMVRFCPETGARLLAGGTTEPMVPKAALDWVAQRFTAALSPSWRGAAQRVIAEALAATSPAPAPPAADGVPATSEPARATETPGDAGEGSL